MSAFNLSAIGLSADSTFVAEFEVIFSSYEAIKTAVGEYCQNDYKTDPAEDFEHEYKMHELPESCIIEYRNCAYKITPSSDDATKFAVSAHTYFDAKRLECFKACLTAFLRDLCENLDRQYQESSSLEEAVASSNEVEVEEEAQVDTWIDKYIEDNRIRSSKPEQEKNQLILDEDEDIYVYDGINIYE
uniref:Uncharacterized protein n=1 Tax=viral metagenome TaxID=1070528 RepID=A0A6C0I793_9ZZZZ